MLARPSFWFICSTWVILARLSLMDMHNVSDGMVSTAHVIPLLVLSIAVLLMGIEEARGKRQPPSGG